MLAHVLLSLASFISLATTQSIDPSTIPIATRNQWCEQQQTSCPLICLQLPNGTASTESNTCDAQTLDYSCVCGNGQTPNSTEYSQTIPYFICTAYNTQCQGNCNGDSTCQANCVQEHPCGAQYPKLYNTTSTTAAATASQTTASTTADATNAVITGWGTDSAASTSTGSSGTTGAAARPLMLELGQLYGLFVVVGGLVGGFAIVL